MDQIYPGKVFPVENRTGSLRTTSLCFLCSKRLFNCCLYTFWRSHRSHYFEHFLKNWFCLAFWALFILTLCKAFRTVLCKQPWLVKPWLNFDLNFSLKSLYNFTGQLKKLKSVMVMVKNFDKDHHFSNFHILNTILFFHDWDSSILNLKLL